MDIDSLTSSGGLKPLPPSPADLLGQLRAAGTIEAVVIALLQNRLLLSTRLGEILTANTLDYRPGERLLLRLSGNPERPVLKASRAPPRPEILDAGRHAALSRALGETGFAVAEVIRATRGGTEIRLAGQRIEVAATQPRRPGELLVLTRDRGQARIELRPLERAAVYRAILKSLLPRRAADQFTALVRAFRFAQESTLASKAGRRSAAPALALEPNAGAARSALAVTAIARPAAATAHTAPRAPTAAQGNSEGSPSAPPFPAGTRITSPPRPPPGATAAPAARDVPRPRPLHFDAAPTAAKIPVERLRGKADAGSPARAPATPRANALAADASGSSPAAAAPTSKPASARSVADNRTQASKYAGGDNRVPDDGAPRSASPAAAKAGNAAAPGAVDRPAFASLLQLVPRLAQIDAPRLQSLFLLSGLIHNPAAAGTAPDPLAPLLALIDRDEFTDALLRQPRRAPAPAQVEDADGAERLPLQLSALAREGTRLVEQALAQNLLQRATLGLQQENQQPVSLAFALPLLDQGQVKPLTVELAQQGRSREDATADRWDIRVGFDFAGLGPIKCHIVLDGSAVAASFYSVEPDTRNAIDEALPALRQQLAGAGFKAGELHSFSGRTAEPQSPAGGDFPQSLIDLEA